MTNWKSRLFSQILAIIVILMFTLGIGLYTGIKNSSDYQISDFEFKEISADVHVYRDEYFVPTIVAENSFDLFFAQGYEMARDRLFQMEFYRSVASGELTRLFGEQAINTDKYLKTLSMEKAAVNSLAKLDPEYVNYLDAFVQGVNKYIDLHESNLPTEFTLLQKQPQKWTTVTPLLMQGVLSQTLSLRSMEREVQRNNFLNIFGAEDSLELLPIEYQPAEEYYLNLTQNDIAPIKQLQLDPETNEMLFNLGDLAGSNNWVVDGSLSSTGNPLLANDPHLSLSTPSIFWQVHLISPEFHVQGVSLPGVPGVIIGHNEQVSWSVTNGRVDAVDLYYFKTNNQGQYWHNNEWKEFENVEHNILGESYTVRNTVYGPVLDPEVFGIIDDVDDYVYVMRWTLLENYDRDQIVKSVLDLNRAQNVVEIQNALEYFGVPGQNFVFAAVNGDIGYQHTGIIPNRTISNAGIIPQNGSDSMYDWNQYIPYTEQYNFTNPGSGYIATANAKVDTRDEFYSVDLYALDYRTQRIEELLQNDNSVTVNDMKSFQDDTLNLYAKFIYQYTREEFLSADYSAAGYQRQFEFALEAMSGWNYKMDRELDAPTIFSVFRIFLEELTFKDEFDANDLDYQLYSTHSDYGITEILSEQNNKWFDIVSTNNEIETRSEIVKMAFQKAITYITEEISSRTVNWDYERNHEVEFSHPMGEQVFLLHEGGIGADGSEHTIKSTGTPDYLNGDVDMKVVYGSAIRFIVEVEPNWENTFSVVPPGQSEHFFVDHRDDMVKLWVNGEYIHLNFGTMFSQDPDFTYNKI